MGMHKNITIDSFPKQGEKLDKRVNVAFHYDTSNTLPGKVIRDDIDEPYETIILLDDGRVVRGQECLYQTA